LKETLQNIKFATLCRMSVTSVGTSLWRPKIFIMIKIRFPLLYGNFTPTLAYLWYLVCHISKNLLVLNLGTCGMVHTRDVFLTLKRYKGCPVRSGPVRPSVPIKFPRKCISVNSRNCTYEFPCQSVD
jgi:hypothetical protein